MRLFVEIVQDESVATHVARAGKQGGEYVRVPGKMLDVKSEIQLGDVAETLGMIIDQVTNAAATLVERSQLVVGQYLFEHIFAKLPQTVTQQIQREKEVEVRILMADEHITQLPWMLLAREGIFLATTGWSIELTSGREAVNVELPPSPKILVVAPILNGKDDTEAIKHLAELEFALSSRDLLLKRDHNLQIVHTWEAFTEKLSSFGPNMIYYYGHGQGNQETACLLFATGAEQALLKVPVSDFALRLRNLATPPAFVYVNCCQGDAAGLLGVGRQLAPFVPVVLANRAIVDIEVAQAQAHSLWDDIVVRGLAPHVAVTRLYSQVNVPNYTGARLRLMTPILYAHYDGWKSNPPKVDDGDIHDPYWRLKLDRVAQFGTVAMQVRGMLRKREPRTHAFTWYGRKGDGIDIFHERLNVGLREELDNTFIYEVRPQWPPEFKSFDRNCRAMLTEAFEITSLEDLTARVRTRNTAAAGNQTLIYIRHQPVSSYEIFDPARLRDYLEWWDSVISPLLDTNQFALLGISFVVEEPARFRAEVKKEGVEELFLKDTAFRLLDEMEKVARSDLVDFLRAQNIRLPQTRLQLTLDKIVKKTRGQYEMTLQELNNVMDNAW